MARRALVVEDDPDIVELLVHYLSADGWTVDALSDGRRALERARAGGHQLVILDLQLPGMDGLELTRRLKADPAHQSIIIIAMTAFAMRGDRERALAAGCDDYITKPIDTGGLPRTIAAHLAARGLP